MEDDDDLVDRVQGLCDLELALLLSFVGQEHCVIGSCEDALDSLADELRLISTNIFNLRCAVVDCREDTTLRDFVTSLLLPAAQLPAPPGGSSTSSNNGGSSGSGSGQQNIHSKSNGVEEHFHLPLNSSTVSRGPAGRSPRSALGNMASAPHAALAGAAAPTAGAVSTPTAAIAPPSLVNVVVAKNLNKAPEVVQIQVLELLRTRRLFARPVVQTAPVPFVFVAVVAAERGFGWGGGGGHGCRKAQRNREDGQKPQRMIAHLNDFFWMGHWHNPEDGFPNLEAETDRTDERERDDVRRGPEPDDAIKPSGPDQRRRDGGSAARSDTGRASSNASFSSTAGHPSIQASPPSLSVADIRRLTALGKNVRVDIEVLRYLMNVVAFLRMHRAVAVIGPNASGLSSVSPAATKHFEKLAQCLSPLHRLDYVTPALVALAARKIYLHRIQTVVMDDEGSLGSRSPLTATLHERSMQWGSDTAAVEALLEGTSPEDVIEDVLGSVVPPI